MAAAPRLVLERPEQQRGVVAPEAERVGQRDSHLAATRLASDVLQVAVWIAVAQVDGRMDLALEDGLDADDGLDRAGGAEQVADHRLGRRDPQLARADRKSTRLNSSHEW